MSKALLAQALYQDIPDDLKSLFNTKLGSFSSLGNPSDEKEAVIVMGKFCVEVQNNLLKPLSGLPVVQALLYLGSLNPPIIASLFSGLESIEGGGPFDVIAPKDGGVYPGFFDAWTVLAPGAEQMSVILGLGDDTESFELSQNDDVWSKNWPVPIGEHTATITDGSQSMTVSFSVLTYEALPPIVTVIDEGTEEIEFRFQVPADTGLKSGEITVTDDSGNVVRTVLMITETIAAGVAIVTAGAPIAIVAGVLAFASGATLVINEVFDL